MQRERRTKGAKELFAALRKRFHAEIERGAEVSREVVQLAHKDFPAKRAEESREQRSRFN